MIHPRDRQPRALFGKIYVYAENEDGRLRLVNVSKTLTQIKRAFVGPATDSSDLPDPSQMTEITEYLEL